MRSRRSVITRKRYSREGSASTPSGRASVLITSLDGTGRFPCTRWFRYPAESPVFSASPRYVVPRSAIRAWIVSPKGSSLNRRLRAIEQSSHTSGNFSDRYALLGPAFANQKIHLPVLERFLAYGEADRATHEVGVGELLAWPLVAVVE